MSGHWLSVSSFFKDQGIKNNSRNRLKARGWLQERSQYLDEIVKKTQQKVIEDEVSVRSRQARLATRLQLKGIQELDNLEVRDVDDARKLITDGMREEREILGFDNKQSKDNNLTQVNISLPKTQFDEILENSTYEELLELIAAIRKEKARRSDKSVTT